MMPKDSSQNAQDLETFIPEGVRIRLSRGTEEFYVIQEFVFKERTEVLRMFSEIFEELLAKGVNLARSSNVAVAMQVVQLAGERLRDVYSMVLKADKEWINDNITLKDEVNIISAILEVNDIPFLVRRIQETINKYQPEKGKK